MIQTHDTERRSSSIDAITSRSVRDGIGERLRDTLRKEPPYSTEIARLIKQLEDQDWQRSSR